MLSAKRVSARIQLVHDAGKCVHVIARRRTLTLEHLRRCVFGRQRPEIVRIERCVTFGPPCNPKIKELRLTLQIHKHVRWLQISVHDATSMCVTQTGKQPVNQFLPADHAQLVHRNSAQTGAQRLPCQELHCQKDQIAIPIKVKDLDDIGVIQVLRVLGFPLKSHEPLLNPCELLGQKLDCDKGVRITSFDAPQIARTEDHTHASVTDFLAQLEALLHDGANPDRVTNGGHTFGHQRRRGP